MPVNNESLNRKLYDLLNVKGYNPKPLDVEGKVTPVPDDAAVIKFDFIKDGKNYGKVWVSIDGSKTLQVYYGDTVSNSPDNVTSGLDYDDTWTGLISHLKNWAQRRQLGFELKNENHLVSDMARRKHSENLGESTLLSDNNLLESDISGLLAAARLNRSFIITAQTAEGDTKKYRVKAQSPNIAKEKFMKHHNMAKILDVKEEDISEGKVKEIGYADKLDDSEYSTDNLLKVGKVIGQIENHDVMSASSGTEKVYFLVVDGEVTAFLGFKNDNLTNIKNFTNTPGVVRALIGYLVHKEGKQIKISADEQLTPDGIKWLIHLTKSPRGLNIQDQTGNPADAVELKKEWNNAKKTGTPGPTSITISENAKFGNKLRENEERRQKSSLLMPFNLYEIPTKKTTPQTIKKGIAEGSDKEAEAWRDWQLKMLPRKMEMLSKLVKGWAPSEADHITAIEAGYNAIKKTGDVNQAAKAIADKFKEIQRQQGVAEGLEDSAIQDIIVDTVERLFRKNDVSDYGALEAIRQGVRHHFSKPDATPESAIEGILNILDKRMRKSGDYLDLGRFKEALRQGIAHQLKKQGVAEGFSDIVKGVKRKVAGKADPEDVEKDYGVRARQAIDFAKKYPTGAAFDDQKKQIDRYNKVAKVVNKKGVAEGSAKTDLHKELLDINQLLKYYKTHPLGSETHRISLETRKKEILSLLKQQGVAKGQETMKQVSEGYYPMGKQGSYSDAVPTTKIIIQHSRKIEEGEQRYRNIAKIFVENTQGERFAVPTTKPGIARVYARHIAEGGTPYDERGKHITSLVEEYQKMAGFVRATKGKQFNESAQQLVSEGINHYQSLRESLRKMTGHRGYMAYFESYTPTLVEDGEEQNNLNELFVQETLDPRIESVIPILSRLHKKVSEMRETGELAEWADGIIDEATDLKSIPKVTDLEESEDSFNEEQLDESRMAEADYILQQIGSGELDLAQILDNPTDQVEEMVSRYLTDWMEQLAIKADLDPKMDKERLLVMLKKNVARTHPVETMEASDDSHLDEDLDANQIRAGQLGPTEKVGPEGAVGKLVGTSESVELSEMDSQDDLAAILKIIKK